jgi:amyloid beta A4 precursor protein-binding family B protein 1-interacting protein
VEQLPALHLERELEEDQQICHILDAWDRNTDNRLLFTSRPGRLDLFRRPEKYLLAAGGTPRSRSALLKEFFITSANSALTIKGPLWIKPERKKSWRKHTFVLDSSGIYYASRERKSFSKSLSPPARLIAFDSGQPNLCCYLGLGWRKKYKAPTDFGFAICQDRQVTKQSSLICLCAETEESLREWLTGLRVAGSKERLWSNFHRLLTDLKERSQSPPAGGLYNAALPPSSRATSSLSLSSAANGETTRRDSIIYSPSSESKSWDSGVCSISEVISRENKSFGQQGLWLGLNYTVY